MKTKFFTLVFMTVLFVVGCKNEKTTTDTQSEAPKKAADSKVNVVLEMIVPQDDTFQIFYTEDGTSNCSEDKSVKVAVKGSPASQQIKFQLSEDLTINYLRLDVGENSKQGKMTMNSFTYNYFDKKFEAKGSLFFQYFNPSEQIAVDIPTATITPTGKGNYDPVLYPSDAFRAELTKMLK